MKQKLLAVLLMSGLSAAAFAVSTTDDAGSKNTSAYTDIQFGGANSSGLNSGVDTAGAMRFDLGGKINPYMGLEGGITMLDGPSGGRVSAPIQMYDMSFKGYLPISDYFNLHGQVGAAYASKGAQTLRTGGGAGGNVPYYNSDSAFKVLVGAGADMYLTQDFAITANSYNYLGTDSLAGGGNTTVYMGGVKYDF